jgi:hypothetical protein
LQKIILVLFVKISPGFALQFFLFSCRC